jgi:hypothetical protein
LLPARLFFPPLRELGEEATIPASPKEEEWFEDD